MAINEPVTRQPNDHYLGDGVYGRIEYGQLVLMTEDGVSVTNRIVFEEETLVAWLRWMESLGVLTSYFGSRKGVKL